MLDYFGVESPSDDKRREVSPPELEVKVLECERVTKKNEKDSQALAIIKFSLLSALKQLSSGPVVPMDLAEL